MSPSERKRDDCRLLRDRLTAEGRAHDASVIQTLLISAASSAGLNKVLHRDNRALRDRLRQAELESAG